MAERVKDKNKVILDKMDELGIRYTPIEERSIAKGVVLGGYDIDASGVSEEKMEEFYEFVGEEHTKLGRQWKRT
jgi:hypothetical protein